MYMIRPDVCCMGCCVKCKCDGQKGKCFRVPFYIRDPQTMEPIDSREAAVRGGRQAGRARPAAQQQPRAYVSPENAGAGGPRPRSQPALTLRRPAPPPAAPSHCRAR
jgi:hypothetical protein